MKYKGVVIKLTKNRAIVTTEDFQCYYLKRNPTIYVGKEIEFTYNEIIKKTHSLITWALSVACAIFVISGFIYFAGINNVNNLLYRPQVFAYVSIDINPGFEMEIDYEGKVLNLVPLDDDAKAVLNNIKFDNVNISEVIDNIMAELKAKGKISSDTKGYILISGTLNLENQESNGEHREKRQRLDIIINEMKNDIENRYKADVCLLQADIEEREDAKSKGISTSRYMVYKSLENELSIEYVKEAAVADLIKRLEGEKSEEMPTATPIQTPLQTMAATPIQTPSQTMTATPIQTPKETPVPIASTQEPAAASINTPTPTQTSISSPQMPVSSPKPADLMLRRYEAGNYSGYYIRIESFRARISPYVDPVEDSVFRIGPGLAAPDCVSFESVNYPGYYLKHENYELVLKKYEDTDLFKADATFRIIPGLADMSMISFQSFNYPNRYIRHKDHLLYIDEIFNDNDKWDATFIRIVFE